MARTANAILTQAQNWMGYNEKDGTHRKILEVYNSHKPLARGYKMQPSDHWCAAFISALAIKCGYTDIMPTECSCSKMINLYKDLGRWVENENRTPNPGDLIFYDWQDSGEGDNKGAPDHVGIVECVTDGTISVIEGNYSEMVKRRFIKVNSIYIRGYATPAYDPVVVEQPKEEPKKENNILMVVQAKDYAKYFNKALNRTYTTTANLNLRHGASSAKKKMCVMPKGTKVRCYGYYSKPLLTKWLYLEVIIDGTKYWGFASENYLK